MTAARVELWPIRSISSRRLAPLFTGQRIAGVPQVVEVETLQAAAVSALPLIIPAQRADQAGTQMQEGAAAPDPAAYGLSPSSGGRSKKQTLAARQASLGALQSGTSRAAGSSFGSSAKNTGIGRAPSSPTLAV